MLAPVPSQRRSTPPPSPTRRRSRHCSARFRWGASASRRTSPARLPGWPPTRPATLRARRSSLTAGSWSTPVASSVSAAHHIGVIADTHLPRKGTRVPEAALHLFEEAQVELILHAGDLSTLAVILQLEAYAPVEAVQGNIELSEV